MLAWIFRRCEGNADARETPIGLVPAQGEGGIDTDGLDIPPATMAKLLEVDVEAWSEQVSQTREHYARFGEHLPVELEAQLDALVQRLGG